MARKWWRQEGGVYIEALVAIAILAIAIVPIIGSFAITPASQRQAGSYVVALNLARKHVEALHDLGGSNWNLTDTTETSTLDGQVYTLSRTVSAPHQADGPTDQFARDVRVTVQWTDAKGINGQVTLWTSVARRPD